VISAILAARLWAVLVMEAHAEYRFLALAKAQLRSQSFQASRPLDRSSLGRRV
jgi:hypothetical protein